MEGLGCGEVAFSWGCTAGTAAATDVAISGKVARALQAPALTEPTAARRSGLQTLLMALPFGAMAAVAAVDLLGGPTLGLLPLMSLGPALAAVSLRPLATALTGVVALGIGALLAVYDHRIDSRPGIVALATVCGVTVAGTVASAARHRREREVTNLLAVAHVARRVLLHPVPGRVGPVRIAVLYKAANAAARIGGDLYEVIVTHGKVRLIVGDVQGKGLDAVQTAAVVLGAFREAAYDEPDLGTIAARIELSLERQSRDEEFVTAVLAQIEADGSSAELLNCGHPAPVRVHRGGVQFVDPPETGLPLGLTELASSPRKQSVVALGDHDKLLFYTDGISEARGKSGEFYPLADCGPLLGGEDPAAALDRLHEDVIRHAGHALSDDSAMLLLSHEAGDAGLNASDRLQRLRYPE